MTWRPEHVYARYLPKYSRAKVREAASREDREDRQYIVAKSTQTPRCCPQNHVFFGCKPSVPDDSLRNLPVPGVVPSSSADATTTKPQLFRRTGLNYLNLRVV